MTDDYGSTSTRIFVITEAGRYDDRFVSDGNTGLLAERRVAVMQ